MSKSRKILLAIALVIVFLVVPLNWYKTKYSMTEAEAFEVLVENPEHQILIASQGSNYKDAIVAELVKQLKGRPVFIKAIDVSRLPSIDPRVWDAMVILHTWENWQPQADAKQFVDRLDAALIGKVIVLTTSGSGDSMMGGVDSITSASTIADVPVKVSMILQRVDGLLSQ